MAQPTAGTQTRRVPELQEMAMEPLAQVHPFTARHYGVSDGEVVGLTTRRGTARFKIKVSPSIRENTVFVPFHWGGAQSANRLTNPALDPIRRMPEFKVCSVRIESGQ